MKSFAYVLAILIHQNLSHERLPFNTKHLQEQSIGTRSDELRSDATQQQRPIITDSSLLQASIQPPRPMLDSDVAPLPNPPIISSTTQFPFTTTAPPAFRRCIQTCGVTSEYSPVCGTNRATYNNMSRLRCAQICGLVVELSNIGRCP
ncbi:hypothetical protein RN001_004094 [Aquatica leii]|uniref:Kazal-like domain-containing protein n=1 Tax=Aquatica leii TaxID=1421715 RepID=A0AAN7QPG2_9COLE|nr:hypothetical protein RN001_004094 [Aquatica leii]